MHKKNCNDYSDAVHAMLDITESSMKAFVLINLFIATLNNKSSCSKFSGNE